MTECQDCKNGIDYKNLGAHKQHCKAKKSKSSDPAGTISKATIISDPISICEPNPADDNQKESIKYIAKEYADSRLGLLNKVLHRNTDKKEDNKPPIIIKNPDQAFRQDEKASESDKLRRFLSDAPLWTKYKPSGTTLFMTKLFNSGKVYAPMVAVGENEAPQVLYMPYEPEKNRFIIPGKGYYITPTQGLPFFFHKDYMLPLVNAPNLKDRFQLPAHIVEAARAGGLAEGMLKSSEDFLKEIRGYKYISYGCILLTIVALVVIAYLINSYQSSVNNMSAQITNMTEVIKAGRGVVLK